jgi:hypothetical protein
MDKQWVPTPKLRWLKTDYGATLMQLHYLYEVDSEGMFGGKLEEKWQAVDVVEEGK